MTYFQIPSVYASYPDLKNNQDTEDISREYFPDTHYEMTHRKARLISDEEDANSVPDYRFGIKGEKAVFWLESKYRVIKQLNEFIPVFNPGQLDRLKGFDHSFLFLRVKIQREEYTFFVPIQDIKTDELHFSFLRPYLLSIAKPVQPALIMKYLNSANQDFPTYISAGIWS
jgi:hypothetical protein